jgi:hypothetical protein
MLASNRARQSDHDTNRRGTDKMTLPFLLNYSVTSDQHPGNVYRILEELQGSP